MPLINGKIELKTKWTNYCVLSPNDYDNANNNDPGNNTILITKTQNYMFLLQLYQQETIKNYQILVAKDFKDQFIGINIKLKVSIKIRQINIDAFSNQVFFGVNRLFALVHSNHGENSRRLKA